MVPTTVIPGCFPELFGFALIDPQGLDDWYAGGAAGLDLLTRFSETEGGDRLTTAGIAIPLFRADPGDYTLVVRDAAAPSPWRDPPTLCSTGWVLAVTSGEVLLTGLGYLSSWAPEDPKHHRVTVPDGTYSVEIRGHVLGPPEDDGAYEFVLTAAASLPQFTAGVSADLNLFGA